MKVERLSITRKTVCNGDTAYVSQLKQQKSKNGAITLAAHRHNVNALLSNSTTASV